MVEKFDSERFCMMVWKLCVFEGCSEVGIEMCVCGVE